MITQEFDINIVPHGLPPRVEVDQYDTGLRTLIAHIYQDDTPLVMTDEYTYTVIGTKPSGTGFSYPATAENGAVVIDVTGQMTVVSGLVECGIIVWSGTDRVGTHRFNLWVQPSALTTDTIIDSDDFDSIIDDAVFSYLETDGAANLNAAIDTWLDEHPEATTTVEDGSLTESKFSAALKKSLQINTGDSLTLYRDAIWFEKNTRLATSPVTDSNFNQMQGGCRLDDGSFVIAYTDPTGGDTSRVKLVKYNSAFAVQSQAFIACNHGNSLCYNGEDILVTNQNNTVLIVDPDTLTVTGSGTLPFANCYKIATDGTYYYCSDNVNLYITDMAFVLVSSYPLDLDGLGYDTIGDWTYLDGLLYAVKWQNYVAVFDLEGHRVKTYNVGAWNSGYYVPEMEFVEAVDDGLMIGATGYVGVNSQYQVHTVFTADLFKGMNGSHKSLFSFSTESLYFDPTYTGVDSDGSSSKPYNNLQYCILDALNPAYENVSSITVLGDYDDIVALDNLVNCTIDFQSNSIPMLRVSNSINVYVQNLNINADSSLSYSATSNAGLFGFNALNLHLYNVAIDCGNTIIPFYIGRSTIYMKGTNPFTNCYSQGILDNAQMYAIFFADSDYSAQLKTGSRVKTKARSTSYSGNTMYYRWLKDDSNTYADYASLGSWTNTTALFTGSVSLDAVGVALIKNKSRFRNIGVEVVGGSNNVRETHFFEAYNNRIAITSLTYNTSGYFLARMELLFNTTSGTCTIQNNGVVDLATGTYYAYNSSLSYPFLRLVNLWLQD